MTTVLTDDFTGTDSDPWDSGKWTTSINVNGSIAIQSNAGRMTTASGAGGDSAVQAIGDTAALGDCEVLIHFNLVSVIGTNKLRVFLRGSGDWAARGFPTSGYFIERLSQSVSNMVLNRRDSDGTITELDTVDVGGVTTGWIRFRAEGDSLSANMWSGLVGDEPAGWMIEAIDNTYSSGVLQLTYQRSGNNIQLDWDDLTLEELAAADQDLNIPFHQQITSFFPMSVANQDNLDTEIDFISSTVQLFAPSVINQDNQDLEISRIESTVALFAPTLTVGDLQLDIPFLSSITQLFSPSIANQSNQDLEVGFVSSTAQLFQASVANQANEDLEVSFVQFLQTFFQPQVFNEGEQVFEPTLVGNGSLADRIIASLIDQGFLTGSITDREYARLLAKLTLVAPQPYSISDLYALAEEPNRLHGVGVDNLGVLA